MKTQLCSKCRKRKDLTDDNWQKRYKEDGTTYWRKQCRECRGYKKWEDKTKDGERKCYQCKTWKPNADFRRDITRKGGFSYMCKKCTNDYSKKYRKKVGLDKIAERSRNRYKKNGREVYTVHRLRDEVLLVFGNKCNYCGFKDKRALQIDHIDGGGTKDKRKKQGPYLYYKRVLEDTSDFQLLCANCNWIKRHTNNELVRDNIKT